jgi:hypothetical protein
MARSWEKRERKVANMISHRGKVDAVASTHDFVGNGGKFVFRHDSPALSNYRIRRH